jgi:flagellar M-ring protein FliF
MTVQAQQKLAAGALLALAIALIVGGWLWAKTPTYAVLFSNLSERDGGNIITALQQMNVPYKFNESGGAILVPQTQVHDVRLKLASQGLPKGGLVGFEIMETQKLGLSQFIEQINYQRALEGELARSIQSLAAVQGARVHLAIPKQSGFLRDEQKPSASVVLNLHPGRSLEPGQVAGISHLVASSVPHLPLANVSVIDQNGNLLSSVGEKKNGLDPSQLKYVEELEGSYVRRIEAILAPIVGPGNARAQVTAEVDFSHIEQMAETYRPNPAPAEAAVRSQQISESSTPGPAAAAGVPGALSNQPPVPATAPLTAAPAAGGTDAAGGAIAATNVRKDATINYELDKTIRHTRQGVGAIKRLSVAVVVNHKRQVDAAGKATMKPLDAKELQQITDLVKEAMGYSKERGDSLNVANTPFAVPEQQAVAETPLWKNPALIATGIEVGKYVLFAGLAAYLFFGVIRPTIRRLMQRAAEAARTQQSFEANALSYAQGGFMSYDAKVDAARQIARQDPKAVANIIKEWVGTPQPANKVQ